MSVQNRGRIDGPYPSPPNAGALLGAAQPPPSVTSAGQAAALDLAAAFETLTAGNIRTRLERGLMALAGDTDPRLPPEIHSEIAAISATLVECFKDGVVDRREAVELLRARPRIQAVLQASDTRGIEMLGGRLTKKIFERLRELESTAARVATLAFADDASNDRALSARIEAFRNVPAHPIQQFRQARDLGVAPREVDVTHLIQKNILPARISRYREGDYIGVWRSDGSVSRGVVVHRGDESLWAAFLDHDGVYAAREVKESSIISKDPLRIGDHLRDPKTGHEIWVTGHDERGKLVGVERARPGVPEFGVDDQRIFEVYASLADQVKEDRSRRADRAVAHVINGAPLPADVGRIPGSYTPDARKLAGINHFAYATPTTDEDRARFPGNVDSGGVQILEGGEIALLTDTRNAGPQVNDGHFGANEDAVIAEQRLLADPTGRNAPMKVSCLAIFDEAAGQAHLDRRGQASSIGVEEFDRHMDALLSGYPDTWNPGQALGNVAQSAHERIRIENRLKKIPAGRETVTTYVGAVVQPGWVTVANSGDSRAMLFGARGDVKQATALHNEGARIFREHGADLATPFANIINGALGDSSPLVADVYDNPSRPPWRTEKGDWLVLISDGAGDANQKKMEDDPQSFQKWHADVTSDEIGRLLAGCNTAAEATEAIRRYVLVESARGDGKLDNISIVVQRITD